MTDYRILECTQNIGRGDSLSYRVETLLLGSGEWEHLKTTLTLPEAETYLERLKSQSHPYESKATMIKEYRF